MTYLRTAVLVSSLVTLPAVAQDWAKQDLDKSPRHQEWVDVKRGDRVLKVFVVHPEAKGKRPAFVIIHENMGLTDWVRDLADQVAATGYIPGARAPVLARPACGKAAGRREDERLRLDGRSAGSDLQARQGRGHRGPRCRRRSGEEAAQLERQDRGGGVLLGRRAVLPLRHRAARSRRGVRLL